jgi:glycosyltransferase involved in cell wall biosynthesis
VSDAPVVSVVVNFLNAEKFIEEAIQSVFTQTYDCWELLLVDDGSTDRSKAIARRHAERLPEQVRYLEHPDHANRGMSASRNLGISNARGRYIAFLDADDVWVPHKLQQQVSTLDSHPLAAMIYGLQEFWYSWTGEPEDRNRDFVHDLGVPPDTLIQPPTLVTRFFFAQDAAIPGPSDFLVRADTIERVGGFEDAFRGAYEDEVFIAKVCLNEPVLPVNTSWDRYRQHPDSSNSKMEKAGEEYSARLFFLNWLAEYLTEQGVKDPQILQGLRKELWRCRHPAISRLWRHRQRVMRATVRRALPASLRHRLRSQEGR